MFGKDTNKQSSYIFLKNYSDVSNIIAARIKGTRNVVNIQVLDNESSVCQGAQHMELRHLKMFLKCSHPSIITLLDHYQTRNNKNIIETHLVMDFMYHSLADVMNSYCYTLLFMPTCMIKAFCFQMFRALSHMRNFRICHRDIRPENIRVDPCTYQLKVYDFGLATRLRKGCVSRRGFNFEVGAMYLRAPEVILDCSNVSGFAVDVWAAGCILAECVMNTNVFSGDTESVVFSEHLWMLGTPPECEEMRPNVIITMPKVLKMGIGERMHEIRSYSYPDQQLPPIDELAIDLLTGILVYLPSQRISSLQACQHLYFKELFSPDISVPVGTALHPSLFCYTPQELCGLSGPSAAKSATAEVVALRDALTPAHVLHTRGSCVDANGWYMRSAGEVENDVDYWLADDASCCGTVNDTVIDDSDTIAYELTVERSPTPVEKSTMELPSGLLSRVWRFISGRPARVHPLPTEH